MKESKSVTKDPICGMTVDDAVAARRAERDGCTVYSYREHCQKKFLLSQNKVVQPRVVTSSLEMNHIYE